MAAKTQALLTLLTLLLISAVLIACPAPGGSGLVGGRTKICDVESKQEIQQLGKYSVSEYNRQQQNSTGVLTFVKVVAAEQQIVAGVKYYLKIIAVECGNQKTFDAEVLVQAWKNSTQLICFGPSPN